MSINTTMVQNGVRTILIGKRRGFCCLKKERKEGLWVVVAQSAVQSTKCKFHKFKLCYYQTSGGREHEFPHRQVCSWGQPCSFPGENRSLKKKNKQQKKASIYQFKSFFCSMPFLSSFHHSPNVLLSQDQSRFQGLPRMNVE